MFKAPIKILIFAGGFFPGKTFGGPPVSIDNFCSLMKDFDCYIVTSDHDNGTIERYKGIQDGWNDRKNAKVLYLSDKDYFSLKKLNEIVREVKPDWIYLQSLFQDLALFGLMVARRNHIRTMLAPRGELCAGAFRKKYKKIPYIVLLRLCGFIRKTHFQSTSVEETDAIHKYLTVKYERIHYLINVPSIPRKQYERPYKERGVGRLVFLSRIHPKKNLIYALDCLSGIKGQVFFDIFGPIEEKGYWEQCEQEINLLPANIQVRYCGLVDHEDVHETFSSYDAFLFPTFSENYGHVIAESLVVGCPVIISDQTPWNDVNEFGAGWAIPLKEKHKYTEAIQQIVDCDDEQMKTYSINAKKMCNTRFETEKLHAAYMKAFSADDRSVEQ